MTQDIFHLGCGAGFSNDRPEGGVGLTKALAACGGPAALFYETLAERTLALAQLARRNDPLSGYEPQLKAFLRPVLAGCLEHKIPILGNFGAANPVAAAQKVLDLGLEEGLTGLKVGVVRGDDLLQTASPKEILGWIRDDRAELDPGKMVSANVYLGAGPLVEALAAGVEVVVTGRVADPSLALAPLIHHFGWSWEDPDLVAAGTLVGHLLECATQISGGYFADPGFKDVPSPAWLGYPLAEVEPSGVAVITKAPGGGLVTKATVTEQILYEIHDPAAYFTPDVVLDITRVRLEEAGPDRVRVRGARGREKPARLKATVAFSDGWLGEAAISYAGPNAAARARLAGRIIKERMARFRPELNLRLDIIGLASLFNDNGGDFLDQVRAEPEDVRLRAALRSPDREGAELLGREVSALYCCGPAGGGGVRTSVFPRLRTASAFVPREAVSPGVTIVGEESA